MMGGDRVEHGGGFTAAAGQLDAEGRMAFAAVGTGQGLAQIVKQGAAARGLDVGLELAGQFGGQQGDFDYIELGITGIEYTN